MFYGDGCMHLLLYPIKKSLPACHCHSLISPRQFSCMPGKSMYFLPRDNESWVKLNLHEAGSIPEVKLQRWIQLIGRNEAERDPTLLGFSPRTWKNRCILECFVVRLADCIAIPPTLYLLEYFERLVRLLHEVKHSPCPIAKKTLYHQELRVLGQHACVSWASLFWVQPTSLIFLSWPYLGNKISLEITFSQC